jgi:hypothetical protein
MSQQTYLNDISYVFIYIIFIFGLIMLPFLKVFSLVVRVFARPIAARTKKMQL